MPKFDTLQNTIMRNSNIPLIFFFLLILASLTSNAKTPTRSDSIDIAHYDLSLTIRNLASKSISGIANVKIKSKVANLTKLQLDLITLKVDSVKLNGIHQIFSQTESNFSVFLSQSQSVNDTFELAISYSGNPSADAQWGGFYFSGNYAYNMGVAFQSKPHNFGRCWFPCVDDFVDRAFYTFHITTDADFVAVCNGIKSPETINPDGSITWHWKLNQSIPTYLASVAVGKYAFIKYDFNGIARNYPVWIAVVADDTLKAKASFAKLNNAISCFEEKYGPYAFDRVGYVGVPFNAGAMEHAANIAYPLYAINGLTTNETLFAHELAHMWWGNLTTCRTAEDMWLNEGWASFNEALFLECVYGRPTYEADIKSKLNNAMLNAAKNDGDWFPVSGVPHDATYGTHVYTKGALMVHTLRTLMGDSAFFQACKSYLSKNQFKDANSNNLRDEFQLFTSINLTNFFDRWIFEKGNIDIAVLQTEQTKNAQGDIALKYTIYEQNRYKKGVNTSLPLVFNSYFKDGNSKSEMVKIQNGIGYTQIQFKESNPLLYYTLNEQNGVALGRTTEKLSIKTTGTLALSNVLLTGNARKVVDSAFMVVEHHWSEAPFPFSTYANGIRLSKERYWSFTSEFSTGLKNDSIEIVFNYNGTANSFLDNELLNSLINEDSLVLLYRPINQSSWAIAEGFVQLSGGSKTDKVGAFRVFKIKEGDYVFGIKDFKVVGLQEMKPIFPLHNSFDFNIIPNPTAGKTSILVDLKKPRYVDWLAIYSLNGEKIKQVIYHSAITSAEVSVGQIIPGTYILQVKSGDQVSTQRFVID